MVGWLPGQSVYDASSQDARGLRWYPVEDGCSEGYSAYNKGSPPAFLVLIWPLTICQLATQALPCTSTGRWS